MERQGAIKDFDGQISWVYCDCLETACAFYAGVLGLPLWRDAGPARIYRTAAGAFIGVCQAFGDRVVNPAGGMITLLTDDVDGSYARLRAQGVPLCGAPKKSPRFGIYSFFCEDPNGYVIEFQTFLDPDPDSPV